MMSNEDVKDVQFQKIGRGFKRGRDGHVERESRFSGLFRAAFSEIGIRYTVYRPEED